ncbi:MAG: hypothetical protein ACRBFS_10105 [Aureispira sp.]
MFSTKWFSTLIIFAISCFLSAAAWAQTTLEDVVYLKNGSILRGQVLEYDPSANIKIQIKGGSILVYASSDVLKMEKETVVAPEEKNPATITPLETVDTPAEEEEIELWEQDIPEKGIYGTASIGNIFPTINTFVPLPGFTVDGSVGYRIHHLLAVGAGAGVMLDFTQSFIYGFGTIRGDILNKSFSPYYEVNVGYGAPLSEASLGRVGDVQEITTMRGGLYLRPSIGMRFASRNNIHTFVDIGVHIQSVYYEGRTWNNFSYTENYTYMRPSIRIGMIF